MMMLIKTTIFYLMISVLMLSTEAFSQQNNSQQSYKLETALIYKLSKFVSWPENTTNQPQSFGLCIIGNKDLVKSLAILKKRKIHGLPIQIHHIDFSAQVNTQCQVIYIDSSRKAHLSFIFEQLKDKSILTLSRLTEFAKQGGIIELSIDTKPIKFTINDLQAKKQNLSINSALLNMSTLISRQTALEE